MGALSQALCSFDEFNCAYYIYPHKLICEYSVGDTIEPGAVKNCDVFIHQDIQIGNPFGYKLSDEYLVSLLKNDCKNIVVPNLNGHGGGFFPQCRSESIFNSHEKNPPLLNGRDKAGMFEHEDQFIDNAVSNRMELNDIMDMAEKDIFTKQEILQNFNKCMDRIKQREKSWDIKVTDFLLENYKKIQLFYDIGHPTGTVIFFYAKKLLHLLLDRPEEEFDRKPGDLKNPIYEMRAHENPVYPCVYDALGLQWRSSSIRGGDDGRKLHKEMDLKEYMKEYIMWCYPDYWEELNQ